MSMHEYVHFSNNGRVSSFPSSSKSCFPISTMAPNLATQSAITMQQLSGERVQDYIDAFLFRLTQDILDE